MSQPQIRAVSAIKNTVLVIDDQSTSRAILEQVVRGIDANILVQPFENPLEAIRWATQRVADLVLVDFQMPEMDGIEVVRRMRLLSEYEHVPIVMVTVNDERWIRYSALDAGVTDFLHKPVDARECMTRCRNLLTLRRQHLVLEDRKRLLENMVQEATLDVRAREKETLYRLARAGEFRDSDTGNHILRMARYSRLIADVIGLSRDEAEAIELAAPLHDIGKIGIPDHILLKPARLTDEEAREMRAHPQIGYEILKDSPSTYLRMGALIALGHHEKFDGSGYPHGLVGDHIPLPARVVAVADVFDALTSIRPYKKAWTSTEAFDYLQAQSSTHLDPELVAAFLRVREQTLAIQREFMDIAPHSTAALLNQ
ncbi:MAG: two-component system response regulator [Betaproteobacteria bacterium RIFCSPLOWO2_02_FULL_62_17]|nr:MAG: two-component system response regulator [Betaproteobacteria bacterium RIFCSPLOWO2_02_FULL_62_17]